MKKQKIIISLVIIGILFFIITITGKTKEGFAKEAVLEIDREEDVTVCTELSGTYPAALNQSEQEKLLSKLAEQIGMEKSCQFKIEENRNGTVISLQTEKENQKGLIQLITAVQAEKEISAKLCEEMCTETCAKEVYMVIRIEASQEHWKSYQERLEQIKKEQNLDGTVYTAFSGNYGKKLELAQKREEEQRIYSELGAEWVTGNRTEELYTIYGSIRSDNLQLVRKSFAGETFAPDRYALKESRVIGGKSVNLNLAFAEDESGNTVWKIGIPVLWQDY